MKFKNNVFIILFILITTIINSDEIKNKESEISENNVIQNFYAVSAGLITVSPLLTASSFVFFGIADICNIEYNFIIDEKFSFAEQWNWNSYTADEYKEFSQAAYILGGLSSGIGGVLGLTSAGFLIAASVIESSKKKNKDNFQKLKFPQWKVLLTYAISFCFPSTMLIGPLAYAIADLYLARKDSSYYGTMDNLGIKYFIAGLGVFSFYELISIACFILTYFSFKRNIEYKAANIQHVIDFDKNNEIKLGLIIKL